MTQEPPFAVQIEPVEGCSLACSFCALQSIRDNGADWQLGIHGKNSVPYRFMDLKTLQRIIFGIKALRWNPRIEFAMHGEPTMHPHLSQFIEYTREALPHAYILLTTNGSGITKPEHVKALFAAGLNTLAFDDYKHASWRQRTRTALLNYAQQKVPMFEYPSDGRGNPHHRTPGKRIVFVQDISQNTAGTHTITNQGGNSGTRKYVGGRCAKPFRELSVRWDGNVALCCDDWKGEYKIGNVTDLSLDELWNHPRFAAARKALYHKRRSAIKVCSVCDVVTYRNGLLPDKKGKMTLGQPNTEDLRTICEAERGKVFSIKLKKGD